MNLKYFKELDGLRGIAALMVMFFHFIPDTSGSSATHYLHRVAVFGQTGVTLFFVLSGFLISRILLNQKAVPHYFRNFYIKRSLRIFPLYYLGLIVFYWLLPLIVPVVPSLNSTLAYWFYAQNITDTFLIPANGPQHYWSLAVEEHFYLFWPLLIYFTTVKNITRLIAGIIVLALGCRVILIGLGYGTFYFTFAVMDALAIGAFLAWYEANRAVIKINFSAVALVSIMALLATWSITGGRGYNWVQIIKPPIIALFYMSIIGLIIKGGTWLNAVAGWPALRFTGKISYGLYVYHPMVYFVVFALCPGLSIWLHILICFGVSYLVAGISFYGFERHILKLKKRFEPSGWASKQEIQYR